MGNAARVLVDASSNRTVVFELNAQRRRQQAAAAGTVVSAAE